MARSAQIFTLETEVVSYDGYVALDGSSNVIAFAPTTAGKPVGPYTLLKGFGNSINGYNGVTAVQPHTSTGIYTFVFDNPHQALLSWNLGIPSATGAQLVWSLAGCNVLNTTTDPMQGVRPGTDASIAARTIVFHCRASGTGTLTDPAANTGFSFSVKVKRSGNI